MKKFLCLLLCFFTVMGAVSCAAPTADPIETEPEVTEVPTRDIVLTDGAGSSYTVILSRADLYGEAQRVLELYKALGGSAVKGLSYASDSATADSDANADACEIIIGDTTRELSVRLSSQLQHPKDYIIYTENNRIAVYARDIQSLKTATESLTSMIHTVDGKRVVTLPQSTYVTYAYPFASLKIDGTPILEYEIVIPADSPSDEGHAADINAWLIENVGAELRVKTPADPVSDHEIVIGNTGRKGDVYTAALAENNYSITSAGGSVYLSYNGRGFGITPDFISLLEKGDITSLAVTGFDDSAAIMYRDNFAVGRLSDELLQSVSPGVLALLSNCMYYEARLQEGIKKGEKWVYSNSSTYVPQGALFDTMAASGKTGSNCALPQAWALMDMGVLGTGKHVYGAQGGGLANMSSLGGALCAVGELTSWGGKYQFNQLYAFDKVKPGDIFFCSGHTFIYLGDEKFMAAGHDGKWHSDPTANTEDSRKAVFETWICNMKTNTDYNYSIYWQLRFKDEFIPKFYRNAKGENVPCPLYEEATSLILKPGKVGKTLVTEGKLK